MRVRTATFLAIAVAFLRKLGRKLLRPVGKTAGSHLDSLGENEEIFYLVFGDDDEKRCVRAFVARGSNSSISDTSQDVIDIVWDNN